LHLVRPLHRVLHPPILPRIQPERSCSLAGNVHQSNDLVATYPTIVAKTRVDPQSGRAQEREGTGRRKDKKLLKEAKILPDPEPFSKGALLP
jgi:hypothetical protein